MISRRRFLMGGVAIGLAPIGAAAHAQEYKAQQAAKLLLLIPTCARPSFEDSMISVTSRGPTSESNTDLPRGRPRHALAAKQATPTIPIVFAGVSDPVESGLVTNLARRAAMLRGCPFSPRS